MIDATLQELWSTKDAIAKESVYDLDKLVKYLKEKYQPNRSENLESQNDVTWAERALEAEKSGYTGLDGMKELLEMAKEKGVTV